MSVRLGCRFYLFSCVCIFPIVLECLVFSLLCVRVNVHVVVDVFICVVCFNEVVCKDGFCSGMECLCVFNVSSFEATSCLDYAEFFAI